MVNQGIGSMRRRSTRARLPSRGTQRPSADSSRSGMRPRASRKARAIRSSLAIRRRCRVLEPGRECLCPRQNPFAVDQEKGLRGCRRRVAARLSWHCRRGHRKISSSGSGELRMIRVSIVRRVCLLNPLGPPIRTSSSSLVASMASRISSASSRWTVRFQSSRFSGSTRSATASSRGGRCADWRYAADVTISRCSGLSLPSVPHKVDRQPVEQLGMTRVVAQIVRSRWQCRQSPRPK